MNRLTSKHRIICPLSFPVEEKEAKLTVLFYDSLRMNWKLSISTSSSRKGKDLSNGL